MNRIPIPLNHHLSQSVFIQIFSIKTNFTWIYIYMNFKNIKRGKKTETATL